MKTIESNYTFNTNLGYSIKIPIGFDKEGKINATTSDTSCRELAIAYLASYLCDKKKGKEKKAAHLNQIKEVMSKARVIFYGLGKMEFDLIDKKGALNVLHMVEEKLGIPKTTTVQIAKLYKKGPYRVMFTGHNKWYRSSHTASLWMLLIRLGIRSLKFRVDTWKELEVAIKKFPNKGAGSNNTITDLYYAKKSFKNWIPLMANINKIFPPNTQWIYRFDAKKVHTHKKGPYINSIGSEGILYLVSNASHHKCVPMFKKIMEQELKK